MSKIQQLAESKTDWNPAWGEQKPANIYQVFQEENAEWATKGGLPCPRKGSGEIHLPKIRTFQVKRQLAGSNRENSTPPAQGHMQEGGTQ